MTIHAKSDEQVCIEQLGGSKRMAGWMWTAQTAEIERLTNVVRDREKRLVTAEIVNQRLRDEVSDLKDCREHLRRLGEIPGCDHVDSPDERGRQVLHIETAFRKLRNNLAVAEDERDDWKRTAIHWQERHVKEAAECSTLQQRLAEAEALLAVEKHENTRWEIVCDEMEVKLAKSEARRKHYELLWDIAVEMRRDQLGRRHKGRGRTAGGEA